MLTPAIMEVRWHPTSHLLALPDELAIEIVGHLTMTSERPKDDLHSLWTTCLSMCRIYGNPVTSRCMALDHCRRGLRWDDVGNYMPSFLA